MPTDEHQRINELLDEAFKKKLVIRRPVKEKDAKAKGENKPKT